MRQGVTFLKTWPAYSEDGAHEGRLPHAALVGFMEGDESDQPEILSADAMGTLIDIATLDGWPEHDGSSGAYDRAAFVCAKAVLELYRSDPALGNETPQRLWEIAVRKWPWLEDPKSMPSTFQWGFGVNVARRMVELPPMKNPALRMVGQDMMLAMCVMGTEIEVIER